MYREMVPQGQSGLKSRPQLSHSEAVITNSTFRPLTLKLKPVSCMLDHLSQAQGKSVSSKE